MADSSTPKEDQPKEEASSSSSIITIIVKTAKDKENVEIQENAAVKEV